MTWGNAFFFHSRELQESLCICKNLWLVSHTLCLSHQYLLIIYSPIWIIKWLNHSFSLSFRSPVSYTVKEFRDGTSYYQCDIERQRFSGIFDGRLPADSPKTQIINANNLDCTFWHVPFHQQAHHKIQRELKTHMWCQGQRRINYH